MTDNLEQMKRDLKQKLKKTKLISQIFFWFSIVGIGYYLGWHVAFLLFIYTFAHTTTCVITYTEEDCENTNRI